MRAVKGDEEGGKRGADDLKMSGIMLCCCRVGKSVQRKKEK